MARIGDIGERQLIEDFRSFIRSEGLIGPGDDAAVIENGTVVTTDVVTFDRHFPAGMTYEQFGWYAAAVNFSDLAAMGARPIGFLAALALPLDLESPRQQRKKSIRRSILLQGLFRNICRDNRYTR